MEYKFPTYFEWDADFHLKMFHVCCNVIVLQIFPSGTYDMYKMPAFTLQGVCTFSNKKATQIKLLHFPKQRETVRLGKNSICIIHTHMSLTYTGASQDSKEKKILSNENRGTDLVPSS